MKFYSRENGRDGEKDWMDSDDFKDVYFEKVPMNYIYEGESLNTKIEFELILKEDKVYFKGEMNFNKNQIISEVEVDPINIVEQGAEAYYREELLDDIKEIVDAKIKVENNLKKIILDNGALLRGTKLDILGLIKIDNNTVATLDDITIENESVIKIDRYYSIIDLSTLGDSTVELLLSKKNKLVSNINNIEILDGKLNIQCENTKTEQNDFDQEYKRATEFKTNEEYAEDRARYINVDSEPEEEFDEFDELF